MTTPVTFLRSIAVRAEDPFIQRYATAFMEKFDRNVDIGWTEDEAWRRAEMQVEHYGRLT